VGRPSQTLDELVRKGTFRAGRHHELLAGDDLPWKSLNRIQERYRTADHELERVAIAKEFAHEIPRLNARRERSKKPLAELLDTLGPPGSYERVVNLFPRFFRLENGKPFRLLPHQTEPLKEFLRRDKRGYRVYNEMLYGATRGSGKTPFASGLNVDAVTTSELPTSVEIPYVFQVAGSKEQARRGFEYIHDWSDSGDLREWLNVGKEISCPTTRGKSRVLSSDGRLAHGRKFRRGIVDEWWLFTTYRETQAYTALQSALQKDPEADLIAISTAGYNLTSQLGEKYSAALELADVRVSDDGCTTIARDPENGFLMYWIGAPANADIENPAIVRACNPLVHDPEMILRELRKPGADELEIRRLLFNQWTKVKDAWLSTGIWRDLRADDVEIPVGADIYIAVDAAYSEDCTAVVYAWRDPNGRIHLRSRVWSTSERWSAHSYVEKPLINEQLVEPYIHELASAYNIREIVFDPEYFTAEAHHLANDGFTIAAMYPQSGDMSDAVRAFKRSAGEGKLGHDGDPVLSAHVEAAQRKKTIRGTKEFDAIDKPPGGAKIDACTAAVMAHWRALIADGTEFVGGFDWDRGDD
jgi:phage terminase large subunit-like protein